MELKNIIFYAVCFIFFHKPIFMQSINIDKNTEIQNELNYTLEIIHKLIQQNYPMEEIIKMLDDEQKYNFNIKNLAAEIQNLINKQIPKNAIIHIVMDNKKSKEYYSQKKFWKKIKYYYITLKTFILIAAIIIIYYFLSRYTKFQWLYNLFPKLQLYKNESDAKKKQPYEKIKPNKNILQILLNPSHKKANIHSRLIEKITKQLEYAREKGLVPSEIPDFIGPHEKAREFTEIGKLIKQQLTYAKSIGLEPTIISDK